MKGLYNKYRRKGWFSKKTISGRCSSRHSKRDLRRAAKVRSKRGMEEVYRDIEKDL